ncbi:elongation factor Ts [bacterium]|nr:elongation factor Ts [bacterium]
MAEITAALVKALRDKTDAGMMDCKRALTETGGDLEAAVDYLRIKGLSKAAKKADRVAAEGLVAISIAGTRAAMVEVNSETDFVARNETFQAAVKTIAGAALKSADVETILGGAAPSGGTIREMLLGLVATIGENMALRRAVSLEVSDGVIASYVHNKMDEGLGRIGVLVALESTGDKAALNDLGREIAMHVASADPAPIALTRDAVDPAVIERERAIQIEATKDSGKPPNVVEKMIEGRLRKFYEEVVLLEQPMFADKDRVISKVVDALAKDLGVPVVLKGFALFKLGEGVEKQQDDFAAEVNALAKG